MKKKEDKRTKQAGAELCQAQSSAKPGNPCHAHFFFVHTAQISDEGASFTTIQKRAPKVMLVLESHVHYVIRQNGNYTSKDGVDG